MGKQAAAQPGSSRGLVAGYLRAQIDELGVREPGARTERPDAVHRMRVACRRLRSSLATFGRLFTGSQAEHLRDELLWLGAVLGPVRDVEVLREHLHATAALVPVEDGLDEMLAGLDRDLAQRSSQAHGELVVALDSSRYAAMVADLTAFADDPPWVAKPTTRHTLSALVGRACTRVDRAAEAAKGVHDMNGPELHEVRKAAKRARYAAEVAAPWAGPAARDLARRMEEVQEVLGSHQDSLMARGLLRDLAGRMPEGQTFALGLLTGLESAGDGHLLAEYQKALAAASTNKVRGWIRG